MSLLFMMDSVATIFRPTSVTRDGAQGVVQVFTVINEGIVCSQQQASPSKQQLYAQQNAIVGTTLYFADDPQTTANDWILAADDYVGKVNAYLVQGDSFPVARFARQVPYGADVQQIQSPDLPATIVQPTATDVTSSGATVGANVASDGDSDLTAVGIVWSATSVNDWPIIGGTGVTNEVGTAVEGMFIQVLSGLTPETTYSFRAYATNGFTTTYGMAMQFTTLEAP